MGKMGEKHAAMCDAVAEIPLTSETIPGLANIVGHERAMARLLQQLYYRMRPEEQATCEALGVYPMHQCCVCHMVRDATAEWRDPPGGFTGKPLSYVSHGYCPKCARDLGRRLDAMRQSVGGE